METFYEGNIGLVFPMLTEDRARENGHKLKEESRWVCIKGIPLFLDSKHGKELVIYINIYICIYIFFFNLQKKKDNIQSITEMLPREFMEDSELL